MLRNGGASSGLGDGPLPRSSRTQCATTEAQTYIARMGERGFKGRVVFFVARLGLLGTRLVLCLLGLLGFLRLPPLARILPSAVS